MRESFSLRLWNKTDPQTKELRLNYYKRIMFNKYHGVPVWKMIIKDTWYDLIN
jgi:hypothetical protein